VHDNKQVRLYLTRSFEHHPRAAASTPGLDNRDDELKQIVTALLSLDNVKEADSPADALSVLRELGVTGRSEFTSPNQEVLSYLRHDGPISYLYLYHFMYETRGPTTVSIKQQGHGAVSRLDEQSGSLEVYPSRIDGDSTLTEVTLRPGEDAILVLDRKEKPVPCQHSLSEEISVQNWSLRVESWDKGEVEKIHEDRGLGYETVEYIPRPSVDIINVGPTALLSWRKIPQVGDEISGVGEYEASFAWSSDISADRYLLDLGDVSGGLGHVTVNGSSPIGFDTLAPLVDISKHIKQGDNALTVRLSTSLNNRLIVNKYHTSEPGFFAAFMGQWPDGGDGLSVKDYGLIGPVKVRSVITK